MATAEQVLDLSRSQLGNGPKKYTDWYPSGNVAWCCIYQSWLLSECGLPTHYAWVSALFDAMRADGRNTYDVRSAMPGDLIAFEWNSTPGGYDHVAMVESVDANGITSIDGNWGNKVTRVFHSFNTGGIAEIARPSYTAPTPPTPPPPLIQIIGDDEMIDRFLARAAGQPEVYLVAPGLGFRWWLPNEDRLRSAVYILNAFGGKILKPPAQAKVEIVAGQPVWVMNPADLNMIPRTA